MTAPKPNPRGNSKKRRIIELCMSDPSLKCREIAARTGSTENYVRWVCQKNGLKKREPHAPIKERYFQLRDEHPDWTAHRIAKEMGANTQSVYNLMRRADQSYVTVRRLGLAARAAGLTIEKIKQMGTGDARHA